MEVQSNSRKPHVAIFPCVGVGHFVPIAQFAKRLCLNHGFSATVITSKWMQPDKQVTYAHYLASSGLDIHFTELPDVDFHDEHDQHMKIETRISKYMEKAAPHVGDILHSLLSSSLPISAFVTDFFCSATFDVAAKLSIPTYLFFTSGARMLSLLLSFPKLALEQDVSFKDEEEYPINVPGVPLFSARDLPEPIKDRSDQAFHCFVHHCSRLPEAAGILINTFEDLEKEALEALEEGKVLSSSRVPSIYSIGPVISESHETHECLEWLDRQPPSTVVYVSFGSGGFLSREQNAEVAHGLETSGRRFLWVVRGENKFLTFNPNQDTNLSELLPNGFLSRTRDRGLVVPNWAPQVAILSHPSIGGFLSHSGWNSTLESISNGVPMICWPLFAEQKFNRIMLVNHDKVAIDVKMERDVFVPRAEVERVVRALMEGEEGIKARENVRVVKEKAKLALMEGGSSYKSMAMAAACFAQK
ncbi:hypothetical protein SUGI_0868160 [Cryptomeria japonica]|uniref:hydroquinone glucosyltransferase n=1 Tax=Cryptomeria japonica TaxID=3369 RepID=UPI0024147004|nr:hydroquinone glucosyltransferase [Cryptomeria japonica]GLJ41928.1 hypothetical protein SUGI_0868160 [Cryptomeria japonica]